jgi:hypothetical protein
MGWARLDDGFYDHPKVSALLEEPGGWAALGFWVACLSWAHKHTRKPGKQAGHVPRAVVARMDRSQGPVMAGQLAKAGLWDPHPGGDGWLIHDFDQYLPSERLSAVRAAAGAKGGKAKAEAARSSSELQEASSELDLAKQIASKRLANTGTGIGSSSSTGSPVVTVSTGALTRDDDKKPETETRRGTRLPEPFTVTREMVDWCRRECPEVDGRRETEAFTDYWRAQPGVKGRKTDWAATWRNWMRRTGRSPSARQRGGGATLPSTATVAQAKALEAARAAEEMFGPQGELEWQKPQMLE